MNNKVRRLVVSNILVLIIILLVYVLSFNGAIETAITNVYSNATYQGEINTKNSVGVMAVVCDDIDTIMIIEKIVSARNDRISYMLSPDLIADNENEIKDLIQNNIEIGIFGDHEEKLFDAIGILKSQYKNDILYVKRNQNNDQDMFSNHINGVVYSIDANIAYEKFLDNFAAYIEEGTFLIFYYEDDKTTKSIFKSINEHGFKIRNVGQMMRN